MNTSLAISLWAALAVACGAAPHDAPAGPLGRWKTIDDATGAAKSVVLIWRDRDRLFGRIEKVLDADPARPEPRCVRCQGGLKGRPLAGLPILWDLRQDGAQWSGGRILDPANGKTYKCLIALEGDGKRLKVRGFIGFSLLGRTQYWIRDE